MVFMASPTQLIRSAAGDISAGVPDPSSVDVERVRKEFPHGEVTVHPVAGGLRVPGGDGIIACLSLTVSAEYPA